MFTLKLLISPSVTAGSDVLFSGKQMNKAHVTLGCGVDGGPQPDKWKHMAQTSETIECQHKDANRGANLFAAHEDSRDDENGRNKESYMRTAGPH